MRRKMPSAPFKTEPAPQSQAPDNGLANFAGNTAFMQHIKTNGHVPMWVHPQIAHKLLLEHMQSGHVVPHPNIDLNDLSK